MSGEPIYPVRAPRAHWSSVGCDADEIVVMLEPDFEHGAKASETRTFVVRERLAVWWWTMMDGRAGHDDKGLVLAAAEALAREPDEVRSAFDAFVRSLEGAGLVTIVSSPEPIAVCGGPVAVPGPEDGLPESAPDSWCLPLDLDAFVREDLVALGSFVGGNNNTSGTWPCNANKGGNGDASAPTNCIPGSGHGYINGGVANVPCG